MRRKPAVRRTKHVDTRNGRFRLVLGAELGERSNDFCSPRPSNRGGAGGLALPPVDNELPSKRPLVSDLVCEARKCQESCAGNAKRITEPPTFIEVFLCSALHGVLRRH